SLLGIVTSFDENRSWRLRLQISLQLAELAQLVEPATVLEGITPVFMKLLEDPVEEIREQTAKATFVVLDRTMKADAKRGLFYFFRIVSFAKSTKYNTREIFVYCFPQFVKLLAPRSFKTIVRPVLFILANDPVPCVRQELLVVIANEKQKHVRHLYGTKRIVALLRDDPDEEIQRILKSDPSLVAIAKATP
ncbi:hypothetical protein WA588_002550, partial [Blastocystis sp. NMH]